MSVLSTVLHSHQPGGSQPASQPAKVGCWLALAGWLGPAAWLAACLAGWLAASRRQQPAAARFSVELGAVITVGGWKTGGGLPRWRWICPLRIITVKTVASG